MTMRDRLAADLRGVMRLSHGPEGPNDLRGDDPHDWMADRLIALGWVRECEYCDPVHVWPCPTIPRCDEPACEKEATCGWPSPEGYRRGCGEHYRKANPR